MNYSLLSSSATPFTYQVKQIASTLSNTDLRQLNSSPFILIPPASKTTFAPIQAAIYFSCQNINTGQNQFIGYENLLGPSLNSNFVSIDTAYFTTGFGQFLAFGIRNQNYWTSNGTLSAPLVLYQQSDDISATFDYYTIIITYIEYSFI